jgi:Zn-finger nucleic acid-binding protein
MIPLPLHAIIEEVWSIQKSRDFAKSILTASGEKEPEEITSELQDSDTESVDGKIWTVRSPQKKWEGPFTLEEVLFLPFFSPYTRIKNLQEDIEAQAKEFPQIRRAVINKNRKKPIDPARLNHCPVCQSLLQQTYYEGISLQICPRCQGKLVDSTVINRIICRKEVGFSEKLLKKAQEFREQFMNYPSLAWKMSGESKGPLFCPSCGIKMLPRPFNYHYVIPVEKCLSCHKIWFDADELEILQILIEKR